MPKEVLRRAVKNVHPAAVSTWNPPRTRWDRALAGLKSADKIKIAEQAVAGEPVWDLLDLQAQVTELVSFVRKANTQSLDVGLADRRAERG